jgi:hypothetical protein
LFANVSARLDPRQSDREGQEMAAGLTSAGDRRKIINRGSEKYCVLLLRTRRICLIDPTGLQGNEDEMI